jgi:hypothetical protein
MTTELRSATEARVTSYEGYSLNKHWKQIEDKLAGTAVVKPARHSLAQLFTLVFRERFVARAPAGQLRNGEYVATRSNWSYHTAISVHSAAWTLNLSCRFEAMGRLDAVIETPEEKPQVVLLAEWEWDHKDVFGKGKELDKLVRGLRALRGAHGFLFTYCPVEEYLGFIQAVVDYWQSKTAKRKHSVLYLPALVYDKERSTLAFRYMRTVEVSGNHIVLWDDITLE